MAVHTGEYHFVGSTVFLTSCLYRKYTVCYILCRQAGIGASSGPVRPTCYSRFATESGHG